MSHVVAELDVRTIPPFERHAKIFGQFDDLQVGQALVIVNDHNPVPLKLQLEGRKPGQVQWTYLQEGPDLWRVQIKKLQADPDRAGSCCSGGACGG